MKYKKIIAILLALTLLACPSLPVYSVESDNLPETPEPPEVVEKEKDELTQDAPDFGKVLDYVDKADFEAHDYEFRVPFAENLNTYVFQDSEGNRTMYMFDENIKYKDSNGYIVDKDLTLVKTDTGYTTTANDVGLVLPDNLKDGVSITYNGHTVKMIPKGTADTVKTEIKENNVIYSDLFGTGISLRYTPLLSGVKEDIVLSQCPDNLAFDFVINTDGLVMSNKNETIILTDYENGCEFSFGQLLILDANGKFGDGNIILSETDNENEYIISINIDEEFLSSPYTVYPITIDPTITVSDNTHGINAIWDSVIYEGRPNSNFGSNYYNIIGIPSGAPSNGVGRVVVKLPAFTSLNEYSSITASQITSVEFHARESAGGTSQYINLYPLVSNTTWTETNVTWNNVGTYTTAVNFGTTAYGAHWTTFDITNLVKGWKNGTYFAGAGFILTSNNSNIEKGFCSSEYTSTYRPYVVMEYCNEVCLNINELVLQEGLSTTVVATTPTNNLYVSWASGDTRIATVNSSGTVTAIRAGTTYVSASVTLGEATYTAYCNVNVLLPNGTYFIKNKQNSRYARVKGTTLTNNGEVCQWDFDGSDMQRWIFTHVGSGYYTIKCSSTSGTYYLGVKDDSLAVDTSVVLRTGTVTNGMKWKLEMTSSGAYKIIPKNAESVDYVLATSVSNTTNGKRLLQGDYVANTSYRDEWYIMMLPTNGYEVNYEPDTWNGNAIRLNSNCYNYALNKKNSIEDGQFYYMQPGGNCLPEPQLYENLEFNGTYYQGLPVLYVDMSDYEGLLSCVEGDSDALQFTFQEIDRYSVCPEGTYKVALVMDVVDNVNITNSRYNNGSCFIEYPDMDYHWYRQNPDGTWSHKLGKTDVINYDDSGRIIYDPQLCDRNYEDYDVVGSVNYSLFVGYFAVSPLE